MSNHDSDIFYYVVTGVVTLFAMLAFSFPAGFMVLIAFLVFKKED